MTFRYASPLASLLLLAACDAGVPDGVEVTPLDATVEVVADGFTIPWGVEVLGENEFLVTERMGALFHIRDGERVALAGLPQTLTVEVEGLTYGGYMDVSLHPQFAANGLVYLAYVTAAGRMAVGRFVFEARAASEWQVIFRSNAFSIGSRIAWSDDDHWFVTQGLGGNPFPEPGAQALRNDGGKIHRLRADGSVPSDNPVFEGATGPSSVWSLGHRDPQGLSFDVDDGRLYANEHGPLGGDELNVIERGGNYGWPLFSYGLNYDESPVSDMTEEDARQSTVLPIAHWGRDLNLAPSGLVRLVGSAFPDWNGTFLMGSLARQRLVAYDPATERTAIVMEDVGRVRDVAQLPSGALLLLVDAGSPGPSDSGRVLRVSPR
ncbi:PQQ-dependent sugar dehydrogenase [Rubrivirga sp. IMCC43871]|uniref:PQQ-dependent sugar dehydrogenase n=1 Tax=Rubrivirga sp. IMCC43871 TaxID=3391575 RepID=UPI00398F9384